jgi:hypothetical protein
MSVRPQTNPIREAIRARLAATVAQYRESETISHAGTKGQLRESYLKAFLKDLLPPNCLLTSGIICDSTGAMSRQADMVVVDRMAIPPIVLYSDVSLIPFESVLLTAEIKSCIDSATTEQIDQQIASIRQLRVAMEQPPSESFLATDGFVCPTILLAFESRKTEDSLCEWFSRQRDILVACVIGKFGLFRTSGDQIERVQAGSESGNLLFNESLAFVGRLHRLLEDVKAMRKAKPIWRAYLEDLGME